MLGGDMAKSMAASASGQRIYAEDQATGAGLSPRPLISVPGMISQAEETQKYAVDRLMCIEGLAARALTIATRLTGPVALSHHSRDRGPVTSGEKLPEASSALDMLQRTIGDVRRPLSAMDDQFERMATAFEALERALG